MFSFLKRLFTSAAPDDGIWKVMEEMDPLLALSRFQKLQLPREKRPVVRQLIDGTTAPEDVDGVKQWCDEQGEPHEGIFALVYALQLAMGGEATTYVFEHGKAAPAARFPKYENEETLTVAFNDQTSHLQITSLAEFLNANDIRNFELKQLGPREVQQEMMHRVQRFQGAIPSQQEDVIAVIDGKRVSLTFERHADADEVVAQPVVAQDISEMLAQFGVEAAPENVQLEQPLQRLGMYRVSVQTEPDKTINIAVWVVPDVADDEN